MFQADRRIQMDPGMTNCDIIVDSVRSEDHGSWMCLVNEPAEFTSDRRLVKKTQYFSSISLI